MSMEMIASSICIVLVIGFSAVFLLLIRSVNQKCGAIFLMIRSDVLLGRLFDYDIRVNTNADKLKGAERLRWIIEKSSEKKGVLPEALLMVSLLNDIDRGLGAVICDASQILTWVTRGERASSLSNYLNIGDGDDAEATLMAILTRFAADGGKPMPRAILRVVSGKSDEDEVIRLISRILETAPTNQAVETAAAP